jgi:hypothetical protein
MRTFAALTLSLFFVACASSSDPDSDGSIDASRVSLSKPTIEIAQLSTVGAAAEKKLTGALPVQYAIRVTNNSDTPIKLTRLNLQTLGSGAYEIRNASQPFSVTIEPNQSQDVKMWASAYIPYSSVAGANGYVSLRATFFFESTKGKFQEIFVENVGGSGV